MCSQPTRLKHPKVRTCIGAQALNDDTDPDAARCLEEPGSERHCAHESAITTGSGRIDTSSIWVTMYSCVLGGSCRVPGRKLPEAPPRVHLCPC